LPATIPEKTRRKFAAMVVRLDEINPKPPGEELSIVPTEEDSADKSQESKTQCPKCGAENITDDQCQDCGIFISKYLQALEKVIVYDE